MAATLKCDTLQNASSANPNITLDANGNASTSGTFAMATSYIRNRLINGGHSVDQRNAGAAQTITAAAALAYTVDRWYGYCTGANVTGQRVAGAVTNTYRYQFTGAASVTAIGFGQRIEAINSADLANTTATLSVDLANSLLTSVTWTAYYATTTDTFGTLASPTRTQISTGTFTVNSTVTRYSVNIAIPSNATTGIEIVFSVGAQTSGTWMIGNVQLEPGSVATPFERRQQGHELALCQRYYEKSFPISTAPANGLEDTRHICAAANSNLRTESINFKVTKRASPTISFYASSVLNTAGNWSYYSAGWVAFVPNTDSANESAFNAAGSANVNTLISGSWTATAEL